MKISKTPTKGIIEELDKFKTKVDELKDDFEEQFTQDHMQILKHKDDWTDVYQDKMMQALTNKNLERLQNRYDIARKCASDRTAFYLSALKRQFDAYFSQGARADFVARLSAYKNFGIIPSDIEYRLLSESATNYAERRILNEFMIGMKKEQNGAGASTFDNPYKMDDKPDIDRSTGSLSSGVDSEKYQINVDIDSAYEALNDYRDAINLVLSHYCSDNEYIYRLTGNFGYAYNVSPEEYNYYVKSVEDHQVGQPHEKVTNGNYETYGLASSSFWTSDKTKELEKTINLLNDTTTRNTPLSKDEKDLLKALFAETPSYVLKDSVRYVWENDSRLGALIEISDYAKYLDE